MASTTAQERLLKKANEKYVNYSFNPAIDIYKRVLDKGFVSADLLKKLGNSYYFNANYKEAAKNYKRLTEEFKEEIGAEYYFRYAQTLKSIGNYEEAGLMMGKFEELASRDSNGVAHKKNYLKHISDNSGRYTLKSFAYNSKYSDFAPTYYKQGLIFSSDRDTGNLARYRHTWNGKDFLDLYKVNVDSISQDLVVKFNPEVKPQGNGASKVRAQSNEITKEKRDLRINTRLHESTSVVTKDGSTLYFTRNNYKDEKKVKGKKGIIRLKIYRAIIENAEVISIEELPFNSDLYSVANPSLSADEKTLYFASDMPGTFGLSDIYKVAINLDGTFGTPVNLGKSINTAGRETFPYVTNKNILYFSSDGHPGLGGLDVFALKIANQKYNGAIQNVGEPVNSKLDDFTFIFDEESREGYFASNREGGMGEDDIYHFLEERPIVFECNQEITGTIRDIITNKILVGATVKVINEENEEVDTTITDANGNYSLVLDCNRGSFVRAVMKGYVPSEDFISASDGINKTIDFYLERENVTAGFGDDLSKLLQLSTIYFDLNKYEVRPDAEIEIQKVIAAMEKYPSLKIKVKSHTDSRGKDAYNLWLSQKRAEATVSYMVTKGIEKDRLEGEGYGETILVNHCKNGTRCSKEEHQLNRRSEFIIFE